MNGTGEISLKKTSTKPTPIRITYEEWLVKIKPHIPIHPPGKTYEQICKEAGVPYRIPPTAWVIKAKSDIGLNNEHTDSKIHRILWFRVEQVKQTLQQKLPNYAVLTTP
jgi:hypothetical protein